MSALLCFGDSNTWGWHEDGRFPHGVRWPGVLRSLLPAGWELVEEGLGGRRASDALAYFDPCLHSHVPLDVVVLFLGVNDPDPPTAATGLPQLVAHAREVGVPRVLVVAAPGFAPVFRPVCNELGAELLDLQGRVAFRDDDPIHLDAPAHRALAHAVAEQLALGEPAVRELRVVVTADDYEDALRFYRDVLGLREREAYASPDGRVTILEAGAATLELADPSQADFIDRVEVGRRVAGQIRLAFEVADSATATDALAAHGAQVVAPPTRTPWGSLNARLETPAGLQITLFEELVPH